MRARTYCVLYVVSSAEPTGPPNALQVKVLSSTSAELTWEPPDFLEQNGLIIEYAVLLFNNGTGRQMIYITPANQTAITFNGNNWNKRMVPLCNVYVYINSFCCRPSEVSAVYSGCCSTE